MVCSSLIHLPPVTDTHVAVVLSLLLLMQLLENDIVMSSSFFMLITYYSVLTDTNERD